MLHEKGVLSYTQRLSIWPSSIYISKPNVLQFLNSGTDIEEMRYKFENRNKALKKWEKIQTDTNYILRFHDKPFWVDYPGRFVIEYYDEEYIENGKKIIPDIEQAIKSQLPSHSFKLDWFSSRFDGPNGYYHEYYVYSNESLYNELKGYNIIKEWNEIRNLIFTAYKKLPNR